MIVEVAACTARPQTTQAHCHTLVVNTCILSTTGYLQNAVHAERSDGHAVSDEAIAHFSPGEDDPQTPSEDVLGHPHGRVRVEVWPADHLLPVRLADRFTELLDAELLSFR